MESQHAALAAYQRVAEAIKADIRAEVLKAGEKLPGNRRVAEQYEVSLGTAQKALGVLEQEGWLVTTPAVGVFVAAQQPTHNETAPDELIDRFNQLLDAVEGFDRRLSALESTVYHGKAPTQDTQDAESGR